MKKLKILLILSLSVNLVLFGAGAFVVYKKGGLDYISKKVTAATETKKEFSPYYYERTSVYDNSNAENVDIAFVGDSLTERGEWSEFYPENKVINRGITGDSTKGLLNRLGELSKGNPQKIFLMIGINDVYEKWDSKITISNYEKILDKLQKQNPTSQVYVQSMLPVNNDILGSTVDNKNVEKINRKVEKLATDRNMTFVDLVPSFSKNGQLNKAYTIDGLHLNGEGYKAWQKEIDKLAN